MTDDKVIDLSRIRKIRAIQKELESTRTAPYLQDPDEELETGYVTLMGYGHGFEPCPRCQNQVMLIYRWMWDVAEIFCPGCHCVVRSGPLPSPHDTPGEAGKYYYRFREAWNRIVRRGAIK